MLRRNDLVFQIKFSECFKHFFKETHFKIANGVYLVVNSCCIFKVMCIGHPEIGCERL